MSLASTGQLKAPAGMFRVVGVDTFEAPDADYLVGDFAEKETAIERARRIQDVVYVYDENGKMVWSR